MNHQQYVFIPIRTNLIGIKQSKHTGHMMWCSWIDNPRGIGEETKYEKVEPDVLVCAKVEVSIVESISSWATKR